MPLQYYFDNLEPTGFQRLVNALLVSRFGESVRLLPLRGPDGGRDAETAPIGGSFEVEAQVAPLLPVRSTLERGLYCFQVKHHRMADRQAATVRSAVVTDFETELRANILSRDPAVRPNYFFLITNVPSSKDSMSKLDEKRRELLSGVTNLHADVLWQDHVVSWLDQSPRVWNAFPEIFAGNKVPALGLVANSGAQGLPRAIRLAISAQSKRDGTVRFRQVNFEQSLTKLFVDLDVHAPRFRNAAAHYIHGSLQLFDSSPESLFPELLFTTPGESAAGVSCIRMLLSESSAAPRRIILEGGPGQGKSTVSQMLAQLYRALLLQNENEYRRIWWRIPQARFPFRIELRLLAEWLGKVDGSIEQYIADLFSRDAGGNAITVDDVHSIVEQQPVILIFDGLDEVGSDALRDSVIQKISECASRFEDDLKADVRVVITSRPPAIAGHVNKLPGFQRFPILPLSDEKVGDYVQRWTSAVCADDAEEQRVSDSFNKRRFEQHVKALVKNPMQLSVLLHFIRLKGEAFPDRRAELYREYFKTVIDRDVEKSPHLRQNREIIEALHEVIGFEIHSRAESDSAAASLSHEQLIEIVETWLKSQSQQPELARELFRTSEERLGLIVALKGEGAETRYGFEVQPVREYFAAAFINDKYEANAHELFPEMVRRSFWREVALFLAGLRRANEKADLLSRARALDEEIDNGWRSDGRAIVLQLLQEGVLTNPGHVFEDALLFLVEYLDPTNRNPKHQTQRLVATLPHLIRASRSPKVRKELNALLDKAKHSNDEYALKQLWSVANRSLPPSDIETQAVNYSAERSDLMANVQLLWPAEAALPPEQLLSRKVLSDTRVTRGWAEQILPAALLEAAITDLDISDCHEMLFEQFAFQQFRESDPKKGIPALRSMPYAIWALCSNFQALALHLEKSEVALAPALKQAQFIGLSETIASAVQELIVSSAEAVNRLNNGKSVRRSLAALVEVIDRLIDQDGLISWIACRCALVLLKCSLSPYYTRVGENRYTATSDSPLRHVEEWIKLRRKLPPFFRSALPADSDSAGRTLAAKIIRLGLHNSCPSHVMLGGSLVAVPVILSEVYNGTRQAPFDWLKRVPIARYWIADIIRADPNLKVLKLVAESKVNWGGPRPTLDRDVIRKVAASVRKSDDKAFFVGALFALVGTKFWNLIGVDKLLKMIEADRNTLDIASALFDSRGHIAGEVPAQRAVHLAELIVRQRIIGTKATATSACRFLLDYSAAERRPLRSLGIFPNATGSRQEAKASG